MPKPTPHLPALLLLPLLAGCASVQTGGSALDRVMKEPPYYSGTTVGVGTLAHVPIRYQRGGSQAEIFDPEATPGSAIDVLLREMNLYLDSLGVSTRVAGQPPADARVPDVYFGCEPDMGLDDCDEAKSGELRLNVQRPSSSWSEWAAGALRTQGADQLLVITLEVGQYYPEQTNLRGSKVVRLGSDHEVSLPWLTSLDAPVMVLQLTGALIGSDGRPMRIGAEGMLARRTNLLVSALGAQAVIRDEDVEALRGARRADLAGTPLIWQAALRNLVMRLAGRTLPAQ